jgi:hypothetical protein
MTENCAAQEDDEMKGGSDLSVASLLNYARKSGDARQWTTGSTATSGTGLSGFGGGGSPLI